MSGAELRDQALAQQIERNPLTVEAVIEEIDRTRRCRLRMASKWDECFTVEQLINDVRQRVKLPIPTDLNGAIGNTARKRNLIENTGRLAEAEREVRKANTVPECRWAV